MQGMVHLNCHPIHSPCSRRAASASASSSLRGASVPHLGRTEDWAVKGSQGRLIFRAPWHGMAQKGHSAPQKGQAPI